MTTGLPQTWPACRPAMRGIAANLAARGADIEEIIIALRGDFPGIEARYPAAYNNVAGEAVHQEPSALGRGPPGRTSRQPSHPDLGRPATVDDQPKLASNGHTSTAVSPSWTAAPNHFYDFIAPSLGEAELRLMLYLIRRLPGFNKTVDWITLEQFMHGIVSVDGFPLDKGTGLAPQHVRIGLEKLVARGLIQVEDNGKRGRALKRLYRINLDALAGRRQKGAP